MNRSSIGAINAAPARTPAVAEAIDRHPATALDHTESGAVLTLHLAMWPEQGGVPPCVLEFRMRNPTGIALLYVSALAAVTWTSAAEAQRVFYEVNGHRYWYNAAKHSGPPAGRGRKARAVVAVRATVTNKDGPAGAAMRTDTGATTLPTPAAPRLAQTRTESIAAPASPTRLSRRAARIQAGREARRRLVEARQAAVAVKAATRPPQTAVATADPTPIRAMPAGENLAPADLNAADSSKALSSNVVPPPPGPVLINTVTYDFGRGVKTTSLRDGTIFVDTFDPQAFFRILPEPGPNATSSISGAPALADARKP